MERLVPDAALRTALEEDMEAVPRAYFDEEVPVPTGWSDRRIGYLRLSAAYDDDAREAAARGWPVVHLDGQHLDIATRPADVAAALRRLAGRR
jgi:hypothetical protein